ncbi:DUF1803 domain-containing protein [Enterococcus wangshanyuanii]|uniref:DUF1803 domain-containing protein n=1 Tax=Enterococcus wangshanyuanii TaxID=2005703 RepID=A0ABQ1NNL4_9ENTE|nr:DUF1803 domain-containing protein [Enterococcus wangshanyuanii]GGC81390.1 hypothetical protein GCM10011573_08750 [Enterococcus wangshanyuanii]
MEKVIYYYKRERAAQLDKLISEPLFEQIMTYLIGNQEQEPILRQLKTAIPTTENLELYLEQMISHGIIQRKNRRYYLSIPIFSQEKRLKIPASTQIFLDESMKKTSSQEPFFGEILWSLFFDDDTDYFFGIKTAETSTTFVKRVEEGNEKLRFIALHLEDTFPLSLADYFSLLTKRAALPDTFKPLERLIGDVDIDYFITQALKVIRSSKRATSRQLKRNIFQEALLVTNDLEKTSDTTFSLTSPILENDNLSEVDEINTLKKLLSPLWEGIEDNNERVFYKKQLYSQLFHYYFPNTDVLHYFAY